MRTHLLLPILLAVPLLGTAQTTTPDRNKAYMNTDADELNNVFTMRPAATGLIGSPFLGPSWLAATVQLVGNTNSTPTILRYDLYRQELRVRRPKADSVVVPLSRIKEFTLTVTGQRFVCYPPATLPADVGGGCGEVLADGPHLQLLKFRRKELAKQAAATSSYSSNATVDVLHETTRYYLRWPADGHFTPLKLKRSSLEQALAGQPAALAALKARKGSLSTEADLTAAVLAADPAIAAGR